MKITLLSRPAAARFTSRWLLTAVLAASACSGAWAQSVTVNNAWARATVPGQKAAGVFMTLSSPVGSRLTSASSPVAAFGQVHEMRMEGDIMKMRALKDGLEIPAGKSVELKPGGYHVMLMDLKNPLMKDTTIPVTLVFVDANGMESKTELTVPVNAMAQMPMAPAAH
jgi:copper(I)-binding protein